MITVVWVKSRGRQQKPAVPTTARLIGCGGRAAAAAAAVVGTHDVDFFFLPFFWYVIMVCRQRCFAQDNNITQQSAWCWYRRIGKNKRWQRQEPPTNCCRLVLQQLLSSRLAVEITLTTAACCCLQQKEWCTVVRSGCISSHTTVMGSVTTYQKQSRQRCPNKTAETLRGGGRVQRRANCVGKHAKLLLNRTLLPPAQ